MKLTPVNLAQEPIRIDAEASHYDFSTQRRANLSPSLATTHAGTQTYNPVGKPIDRDND
jgi:hypothetical protein